MQISSHISQGKITVSIGDQLFDLNPAQASVLIAKLSSDLAEIIETEAVK